MKAIRIAVYEDNSTLRESLEEVFGLIENFQLVGSHSNCNSVKVETVAEKPDVVLMDIDMPGKNGIEGLKEIKKIDPSIEVIMHTVFEDDDKVFDAIKNGATGYILKKTPLSELVYCINDVSQGGAPMTSSIARRVMNHFSSPKRNHELEKLSPREIEVINAFSEGLSYKMVADQLNISIETVRTHCKKIYSKLQVHSLTEVINKIYLK